MQKNESISLKILTISCFLAFSGWFIKAVIDSILLYNKPFLEVLFFDIPSSEIYIRFFVSICFFIFGSIIINNYYQKKQAYEKIRKLNVELEKKVDERTKKIENLLRDKNQLIINMGHDLRTPLTPLMGLMPNIIKKEKDPKLKKLLEVSLENINYLCEMVNKTIDIARYDADLIDLKIEKALLSEEVDKVVKNNEYLLRKNNVFVDNNIDEDLKVEFDKLRLREVFSHLFKNSVEYNDKDEGLIVIDAESKDDSVVVCVTDNGKGLEKEDLEHVFDELYKTDKSRHDLKSNGLGLSICKRIIEKHDGEIWVESLGSNKGTKVFFTIPKTKK